MFKIPRLLTILFTLCFPVVAQEKNDWWKMSDRQSSEQHVKHNEKIKYSYDRFKDITMLLLEYMEVGEGVWMGAFVGPAANPHRP